MSYFLLVYDRERGEILTEREYPVHAREHALRARADLVAEQTDPNIEVVLLGADSREDLRKTHGRYFMSVREAAAAR